jgi:hypothetical protein
MYPTPYYSKRLFDNWNGSVWKHAAIPRAVLPYSITAAVLTVFFVWLIRYQERRASVNTAIEEPQYSAGGNSEFNMEGVKMMLAVAFSNTNNKQPPAIDWSRPYPYPAFAATFGFLLIFRYCFMLRSSLICRS